MRLLMCSAGLATCAPSLMHGPCLSEVSKYAYPSQTLAHDLSCSSKVCEGGLQCLSVRDASMTHWRPQGPQPNGPVAPPPMGPRVPCARAQGQGPGRAREGAPMRVRGPVHTAHRHTFMNPAVPVCCACDTPLCRDDASPPPPPPLPWRGQSGGVPYGPLGLAGQQRCTREPSRAGPRAGKRSARPGTPPPATSAPGRGSAGSSYYGGATCAYRQSRSAGPPQSCLAHTRPRAYAVVGRAGSVSL